MQGSGWREEVQGSGRRCRTQGGGRRCRAQGGGGGGAGLREEVEEVQGSERSSTLILQPGSKFLFK